MLQLFLLFSIVPIIELYLLIKLGTIYGPGLTLLVIIGTGLLGAYWARREGAQAFIRFHNELQAGKFPANELLDAALVLVASVLLITPGLLTDLTGFLLLLPPSRYVIKQIIKRKIANMIKTRLQTGVVIDTTIISDNRDVSNPAAEQGIDGSGED